MKENQPPNTLRNFLYAMLGLVALAAVLGSISFAVWNKKEHEYRMERLKIESYKQQALSEISQESQQ